MISEGPFPPLPFCDFPDYFLTTSSFLPTSAFSLIAEGGRCMCSFSTFIPQLLSLLTCHNFKFICQFQTNLIEVSKALTSPKAPGRRKLYTRVTTEHNSCLVWLATGQREPVWLGARHTQHMAVCSATEKHGREQREWWRRTWSKGRGNLRHRKGHEVGS